MSRWQSSSNVEGRDCSRGLLALKYGAARQPEPLRLQASRGKATDASASVPLPRRLHLVPFAAIPSKKGKGTLEKNCLDRQLRLLVDSFLAERVLCATNAHRAPCGCITPTWRVVPNLLICSLSSPAHSQSCSCVSQPRSTNVLS